MTSRQTALRAKAAAAQDEAPEEAPEERHDLEAEGPFPEERHDLAPEEPGPEEEPEQASRADIAAALRQGIDVEVSDSQVIAWKIAQRILDSETADDVWEPMAPIDASQLINQPIRVVEFETLKSAHQGPLGVYLIIDAVDLTTGEMLLIKCGATNVVAQLVRAQQLGALPEDLRFEAKASALHPDRTLYWLRKVPAEQRP